jgi:predicted transcriptional regulator
MSYAQIQKYLGFLLSHGFINKVKLGNPSVSYQVTEKGGELLRNIDGIVEVLEFRNGNNGHGA